MIREKTWPCGLGYVKEPIGRKFLGVKAQRVAKGAPSGKRLETEIIYVVDAPIRCHSFAIMAIEFEDIQELLSSRIGELRCPICGKLLWVAPHGDIRKAMISLGSIDAVGPPASSDQIAGQQFLPLVWISCANCGHTEFFAKKLIDQWKNSRDLAGADSD